jgi:hypothetical protein
VLRKLTLFVVEITFTIVEIKLSVSKSDSIQHGQNHTCLLEAKIKVWKKRKFHINSHFCVKISLERFKNTIMSGKITLIVSIVSHWFCVRFQIHMCVCVGVSVHVSVCVSVCSRYICARRIYINRVKIALCVLKLYSSLEHSWVLKSQSIYQKHI